MVNIQLLRYTIVVVLGIEREIDNAESKDELDWIFDEIRILEGIRSSVRMIA
jgi:hypothetical protein